MKNKKYNIDHKNNKFDDNRLSNLKLIKIEPNKPKKPLK